MTTPRVDSPPLDPGPPPAPPASAPSRTTAGDRFFSWTAGLGIVRGDGWLGGVAAGLAARMRVDPLIVRGILVVVGLFGFPVLFLYAIAWALLPDLDGRIPLQDAVRGRFTPALAGIAACAVLGLLPAPLAFLIGAPTLFSVASYGGSLTMLGILAAIVGALLVGGLLFLIVRAALQTPRAPLPATSVPDQRTASAASVAPVSAAASGSGPGDRADAEVVDAVGFAASASSLPAAWVTADPAPPEATAPASGAETEPQSSSGTAAHPSSTEEHGDAAELPGPGTTGRETPAAEAPATEPPVAETSGAETSAAEPPGAGTPAPSDDAAAEYAAWREQHAAWKAQDDAWRRQQQDAARLAREQARRERQERGAAFSAEAAERRRVRRLTRPRTPFAYVAVVVGIAIVAGALTAVSGTSELSPARGLFVAALVTALGMTVAGILRRRSGFLAFVTVLLLAGGTGATAATSLNALHLGDYGISNLGGADWPASAPFVQPWGNASVYLAETGQAHPIYIEKRSGGTRVTVEPGVTLHLDITAPDWSTMLMRPDGDTTDLRDEPGASVTTAPDGRTRYVATIAASNPQSTTEQTLVIDQESGWIEIQLLPPTERPAEESE